MHCTGLHWNTEQILYIYGFTACRKHHQGWGWDWAGVRIMGKAGRVREFSLVLQFVTGAFLECFFSCNFEPLLITFEGYVRTGLGSESS